MSSIKNIPAVVANFLRRHVAAAQTMGTFLYRLVETISPRKQFWPRAQYKPASTDLQQRTTTAAEVSLKVKTGQMEQLKQARAWANNYYQSHHLSAQSSDKLVTAALEQISQNHPLRAVALFEISMMETSGDIIDNLPSTRFSGLSRADREDDNKEQYQQQMTAALTQISDLINTSTYKIRFSPAVLDEVKEAANRAYRSVLAQEQDF